MKNYIYKQQSKIFKHGVNIFTYPDISKDYSIVYEEVEAGHFEEFKNHKSTFNWFIIDGEGTFVINDQEYKVTKNDFLSVPPNNRVYYLGKMKMLLISFPKFNPIDETHIRDIK